MHLGSLIHNLALQTISLHKLDQVFAIELDLMLGASFLEVVYLSDAKVVLVFGAQSSVDVLPFICQLLRQLLLESIRLEE